VLFLVSPRPDSANFPRDPLAKPPMSFAIANQARSHALEIDNRGVVPDLIRQFEAFRNLDQIERRIHANADSTDLKHGVEIRKHAGRLVDLGVFWFSMFRIPRSRLSARCAEAPHERLAPGSGGGAPHRSFQALDEADGNWPATSLPPW